MIDVILYVYVGGCMGSWLAWSWTEPGETIWLSLTLKERALSLIVSFTIVIMPAHYLAEWAKSL